ncbi:MetQ/NlpA family ABC transporter substrate-binding protein [Stomatohabitans albus]|uniref:MetQ/NlpA family ABC transporter substrate-binding protein n=1 Tax=Stomatohabitans albus TaxID=3110766 RepID=UPI00300DAE96
MKKLIAVVAASAFALAACAAPSSTDSASAGASSGASTAAGEGGKLGTLKVGATASPEAEIIQYVIDSGQAERAGLVVEIQEFSDYTTPNQALADGSNDANLFQHQPFLDEYLANNPNDKIVTVGPVHLTPMAVYSKTLKSIDELGEGARLAIPNDPSNEARALELLSREGLIKVEQDATSIDQITDNPKKLEIRELEAATLPSALDDFDAAAINYNYAAGAGLTAESQIAVEPQDSVWYNIVATREELKDDPRITTFYSLLTSDETKKWMETEWKGLVIPAP